MEDIMRVIISEYKPCLLNEIVQFRSNAYTAARRDPRQIATWSNDKFDKVATHFIAYSEKGELIGAMRIINGTEWSLDKYFSFNYDKERDVEFGRLAVSRREELGMRVLFELIHFACLWCTQNGRENSYGFVIHRFKNALVRQKVPFEVLSPSINPYGEESNLIRFSLFELQAYYRNQSKVTTSANRSWFLSKWWNFKIMTSPINKETQQKTENARANYVTNIDGIRELSQKEREELRPVSDKFVFRVNEYYLKLINWDDPHDPIRQLIIPQVDELEERGTLDTSNEQSVTVANGVQHKYVDTVLLLCNSVCGGYCRYCFRKRLFMADNSEVSNDLSLGFQYIREHPEVNNVLLTGGDPLLMSPRRLRSILVQLREIPHVRIIRLGSKMMAFDPLRIVQNLEMQQMFREFSQPEQRIYLMAHFDHPRELTSESIEAIDCCIRNQVICVNQCPLIKGVNDHPDVLAELFEKLSFIGCQPYYLFQCRPTQGNCPYQTTIVEGYHVFSKAMARGSGLSQQARYCMSHESGKIQIVHVDEQFIFLRYHQAKHPADLGRFLICHRDDNAYWFDQLAPVTGLQIAQFWQIQFWHFQLKLPWINKLHKWYKKQKASTARNGPKSSLFARRLCYYLDTMKYELDPTRFRQEQ